MSYFALDPVELASRYADHVAQRVGVLSGERAGNTREKDEEADRNARAINKRGHVTLAPRRREGTTHALVWDGSMHDLNDLIDPNAPRKPFVIALHSRLLSRGGSLFRNPLSAFDAC